MIFYNMDHGVFLNVNEIDLAHKFLHKTPMVYACRNVLHQHLFGNGILFGHRRGRIRPDPHMQEIMTDFWLPFCKEMLDSVLTMGVVPIRIITLQDDLRVPVVLEPNCARIKMTYSYGVRTYVVLDEQQEEIPDTLVLDTFGYSPFSTGSVKSIVCNLIPQIKYVNMMMGTTLTMERKRADPVIITEAVDTKVDSVEGINYDYYADGDMQDNSDQNKFQRNRSNVAQLAHQQAMYDHFFSGGQAPSTGSAVLDNVVTLPMGQRVVNTPSQTGRGDLVAQVKVFEDIVCGVMGVPRSLIMSDTPHKSDSEGTHHTFQKTIMAWKSNIQQACEQIYNIVYASAIKSQLMNAMGKKRKRKDDIADVYALKKRLQVEIQFPVSPFMSHEQLFTHYTRGVLPWDTYVEHACAHACLPHQKMPEPSQINMDGEPSENRASKTDKDGKQNKKDDSGEQDDPKDKKEDENKKEKKDDEKKKKKEDKKKK